VRFLGWVAFVAAGAVGACLRFLVDLAVNERFDGVLPWGTLVVNASGSLVLGLVTGLALHHGLPTTATIVLGTGFCGAYTTFSTFTLETVVILEEGAPGRALVNVLGMLATGAAAAGLGLALAGL